MLPEFDGIKVGDIVYDFFGRDWVVTLVGNRAFQVEREGKKRQVTFDGVIDGRERLGRAFFLHKQPHGKG